ncbi:MAG: YciI family protein [Pyrinomonadaceae bacterium]|nr:YciI family protein [Pyrinomonadaceae bacterium]
MKFILMMGMKTDKENMSKYIMTWPKEDIQAHIGFMIGLNKDLKEAGELVSAEGLAWPNEAKLVRAGKDGTPITDGVFPESKEFLIGYWIIDVENTQRAYQVAARASAAPGPGGAPLNMPIEVRQIMSGPPEELQ